MRRAACYHTASRASASAPRTVKRTRCSELRTMLERDEYKMAVPKRKTGRARTNSRRSSHTISAPAVSVCPQCHQPKLPHRVCPECGFYNGKEIIDTE